MAASIGAVIVQAAMARGVSADALRRSTGFDVRVAADPDARITLAQETALWAEAARLANDDALGLHAAELVQAGAFDALDYAIRSAPTAGAAIAQLLRYNRLIHDAAVYTLQRGTARARVEHRFAEQQRHSAEFTLGAFMVISAQVLGSPLRAALVQFHTPAPAEDGTLDEHRRIFGVTPRFSQPVNAIEFPASELDRPVLSADPALARLVTRHADALLAALPDANETTSLRVRRALAALLGKEDATLAAVSSKLRASERSLQRRLAAEATSFEAQLEVTRRELAQRYLADPKLALGEIAFLLGYSESSAFHRAWKRWTGVTPTEARAALLRASARS